MTSPSPPFDLDALAPEAAPGIRVLPVVHEHADLAPLVRAVLEALDPAAVAVELPTTLGPALEQALRRLPRVSLVISENEDDEADADALVWTVTPGDPLVEAARWALERGRPLLCIDPDVPYPVEHREALPDPHAIWGIGPARYLEVVATLLASAPHTAADELRERGMAFHLQQAAGAGRTPLLALIGAAHAAAVGELLGRPTAEPLARQRRSSVLVRHVHPDDLAALLSDPPLAHAAWELVRDGAVPAAPDLARTVSRRVELVRDGLRLITGQPAEGDGPRRHALAAYAAHHAARPGVGGRPAPHQGDLAEVVWRVATASWEETTREQAQPWQRRTAFDFARRYARIQGRLAPGLYEQVVAARGVADDNLGWEVLEAGRCYPWQEAAAELETVRVDDDRLRVGARTVRFRRRFFRVKQRPVAVRMRRRPAPDDPAEWLDAFDGSGICSWPPEDVVVEDYGRYLKQRARAVVSAERTRSLPFSTSLLDGVDVRETLRHWHEGTVWVRELGRAPGEAGSVVVIFDPDEAGYPYRITWTGEHEQESDMALYATDPTQQVVGPGIMRASYGAFVMTFPPGRLYDVWSDADYADAASAAEVLVLAGIDYSLDTLIVHVAPRPPRERLTRHAAAQGKRLVHIPLGSLSPAALRRLRTVHVLVGHRTRSVARDFIW